jgi:hypothetical protein
LGRAANNAKSFARPNIFYHLNSSAISLLW